MTAKELMYVEDALGHEQYFQTQCRQTASELQDPQLRACVEQLATGHSQLFRNFYGLLHIIIIDFVVI